MYSLVPGLSANTQNDSSFCVFAESLGTRLVHVHVVTLVDSSSGGACKEIG